MFFLILQVKKNKLEQFNVIAKASDELNENSNDEVEGEDAKEIETV